MKIIIKNGYIIDPASRREGPGNIFIDGGRITRISINGKSAINGPEADIIDAGGMFVAPGLIDLHTHLREPGFEHKETIRTGTMAAVRGGFTTICCMPNTNPPIDSPETVSLIRQRSKEGGSCTVLPVGAITRGQKGLELVDFKTLQQAGCAAFSDDGRPVMNSRLMRTALEYSRASGCLVIAHCEDLFLAEGGVMNEGKVSGSLGLKGIPAAAEDIMVARDILLAGLTRGRLHIAHVSTKGSVELIRRAKNDGIVITAETCPHYFSITEDIVRECGTKAKVNPPLRTAEDVEAIKGGLKDGTIDIIATDHAPHHAAEKALNFDKAPFGISGLETAFSLSLGLVREGVLAMSQLINKMSLFPAGMIGAEGGALREGARADIMIFDKDAEWTVSPDLFLSAGKNTPFEGMKLKGKPLITIANGNIFYTENGKAL
jgi:dihydroorotase